MTVTVKHINEFPYGYNSLTGKYFTQISGGEPMSEDDCKKIDNLNWVIGYKGNDPNLSSWVHKKSFNMNNIRVQSSNVPIATVRQNLFYWYKEWGVNPKDFYSNIKKVKGQHPDIWSNYLEYRRVVAVAEKAKTEDITIYYLSSQYDKGHAKLIESFINWWIA